MAGVSMVQPTPFPPREPSPDRDFYCREHSPELHLAQDFQSSSLIREIIGMTVAILSLGSMAYYVMTGSDFALAAWLFFSAMVWVL